MTDILKFQILLNSVHCGFKAMYCEDENGWDTNNPDDYTPRAYITLEIGDVNIVFDSLGGFKKITHHG